MMLRQLVSTFLIQAMLVTSAGAYAPSSAVFLLNEGRRELRCQLTPDNIELFSTEEFQGLVKNHALATVDSPADGLRPCDENDVFYAQIVFGDVSRAGVANSGELVAFLAAGIFSGFMIMAPVFFANDKKKSPLPPTLEETVETVCGERRALVDGDEILCFDEEESEEGLSPIH